MTEKSQQGKIVNATVLTAGQPIDNDDNVTPPHHSKTNLHEVIIVHTDV